MGANIDAAAEAARLGIPEDRAATCFADGSGTRAAYAAMASATCKARSGMLAGEAWRDAIEQDAAARGLATAAAPESAAQALGAVRRVGATRRGSGTRGLGSWTAKGAAALCGRRGRCTLRAGWTTGRRGQPPRG